MAGKKGNLQTGCKRNGCICPNCGKIHPDMTGENNVNNYPGVKDKQIKSKLEHHHLRGKTYLEVYGEDKTNDIAKRRTPKLTGYTNPWFGKHHTTEARNLMSQISMGKRSGENHWTYNREFSSEHKQKLSKSHIGIQALDKHPLWKGGVSFLPYTIEFNRKIRREIIERDNCICQLCGIEEINYYQALSVHHIDYIKENLHKENLIALCRSCNAKVNINRDKWTQYFQNLIEVKYS